MLKKKALYEKEKMLVDSDLFFQVYNQYTFNLSAANVSVWILSSGEAFEFVDGKMYCIIRERIRIRLVIEKMSLRNMDVSQTMCIKIRSQFGLISDTHNVNF